MSKEVAIIAQYEAYITALKEEENPLLNEMEQYAKEHHVPIMERHGIQTFIGLLSLQKPKNILELGSAIGYSAIRMAEAFPNAMITTIERDPERFQQAERYIERAGLVQQIQIIEADALEWDPAALEKHPYDALFIDAAKGQYQRFFEKYEAFVGPGGVIYCDNMFMHGMVLKDIKEIPRRKRTMIRNLTAFTTWIMSHPNFETYLLPVGDGLLIAIKKEA